MVAGTASLYIYSTLATTSRFWTDMQRESNLNNAVLMARRRAAIPRGVGQSHEVFIARGDNAEAGGQGHRQAGPSQGGHHLCDRRTRRGDCLLARAVS